MVRKIAYLIIILALVVSQAWAATYYKKSNGTAANKAAATGDCASCLSDPSTCMNQAVYSGETFADGDVIISCHVPVGLPGKIWSESFVDASQTLSIPAVEYALMETEDKILLESSGSIILE